MNKEHSPLEKKEWKKNYIEKMREKIHRFLKSSMFLLFLYGGIETTMKSMRYIYLIKTKEIRDKEKKFDGGYHKNTEDIIAGKYQYYSELSFNTYESFKRILDEDPTFLDNIVMEYFMGTHSYDIKSVLERIAADKEVEKLLLEKLEKDGEQNTIDAIHIFQKENYDAEKAEKKIIEMFTRRKFKQIQEHIKLFHKAKEERIEILKSDTYLKRLTIELDGNREKAEKLQKKLLKNLEDASFYISNFPYNTTDTSSGFSDELGFIVLGNKVGYFTALHELLHHTTENGINIPNRTKRKLTSLSTFKENMTAKEKRNEEEYREKSHRSYYRSADEILARKVCFDTELEKLGIKKYDESFTEEHYKKVEKLEKEGKLNLNSDQFFRMFKRDTLIMIMNTVAFQEYLKTGKLDEEKLKKELEVAILNEQEEDYYPPEFWVNSDTV